MSYDQINSLADIRALKAAASSEDGETSVLELKGNATGVFKATEKKLLEKEICALANTYGGVLIFHGGKDDDLKGFSDDFAKGEFTKVESWLASCLETRLIGIRLKIIEDVFVIDVPESLTKPHRTNSSKDYYYRHETTSRKMPEIMVSSMYRSQDYLNFAFSINISKMGKRLSSSIFISNSSNLSGTNPKVQIQIYGSESLGKMLRFSKRDFIDSKVAGTYSTSPLYNQLEIPFLGHFQTSNHFRNEILYPQDRLSLLCFSDDNEKIEGLSHILLRADCMFQESKRQTLHQIVSFNSENKPEIILSSNHSNGDSVIRRFESLIKAS